MKLFRFLKKLIDIEYQISGGTLIYFIAACLAACIIATSMFYHLIIYAK